MRGHSVEYVAWDTSLMRGENECSSRSDFSVLPRHDFEMGTNDVRLSTEYVGVAQRFLHDRFRKDFLRHINTHRKTVSQDLSLF